MSSKVLKTEFRSLLSFKVCNCFTVFIIRKLKQQSLIQLVTLLEPEPRPPNSSCSDTCLPISVLVQPEGLRGKREPLFTIFMQRPQLWLGISMQGCDLQGCLVDTFPEVISSVLFIVLCERPWKLHLQMRKRLAQCLCLSWVTQNADVLTPSGIPCWSPVFIPFVISRLSLS